MQQFSLLPSSPKLETAPLKSSQEQAVASDSDGFASALNRVQKTQSVQSEITADEPVLIDLKESTQPYTLKNTSLNTNINQGQANPALSQNLPQKVSLGEILPLSEHDFNASSLTDYQRALDTDSTNSVSLSGLTSADMETDGAPLSINEQGYKAFSDEPLGLAQRSVGVGLNSSSFSMLAPQTSRGPGVLIDESSTKSENTRLALFGVGENANGSINARSSAAASSLGLSSVTGTNEFYSISASYQNPLELKSSSQPKTSNIKGAQASEPGNGNAMQGVVNSPFLAKQVITAGSESLGANNLEHSILSYGYLGDSKGRVGESLNDFLNSGLTKLSKSDRLPPSPGIVDFPLGITAQAAASTFGGDAVAISDQQYGASLTSGVARSNVSLDSELRSASKVKLPQASGVSFESELGLRHNLGEHSSNPLLAAGQNNQSGYFLNALVTESDQLFKVDATKSVMESLLGGDSADELDVSTLSDRSFSKVNTLSAKESAGSIARPYVSALHLPVDDAQWVNSLSEKLMWLSSRQINTTELHLNPADLGPIDVRIQVQGDQTSINFNAQSASVRELLEINIQRLRDMLGESMHDTEIDLSMNDPKDERFESENFSSHQDAEDTRFSDASDSAEGESAEHALAGDDGLNSPGDSERLINARV